MALGSGSAKRVLIAIPPPAATLQAARGLVGLAGADSQAASVPAFLRSSVSMIDRGLSTFESAPGRCAGGGFQACYEIISGVGGWSESRPESQSTPLGKMSNPGTRQPASAQRPAPSHPTSHQLCPSLLSQPEFGLRRRAAGLGGCAAHALSSAEMLPFRLGKSASEQVEQAASRLLLQRAEARAQQRNGNRGAKQLGDFDEDVHHPCGITAAWLTFVLVVAGVMAVAGIHDPFHSILFAINGNPDHAERTGASQPRPASMPAGFLPPPRVARVPRPQAAATSAGGRGSQVLMDGHGRLHGEGVAELRGRHALPPGLSVAGATQQEVWSGRRPHEGAAAVADRLAGLSAGDGGNRSAGGSNATGALNPSSTAGGVSGSGTQVAASGLL
jgi:hypothetical protein